MSAHHGVQKRERPAVGADRLQRGAAEEGEAEAVVGVVGAALPVGALAIEGERVLDQAEPVPVGAGGQDVDRGDVALVVAAGIGDRDRRPSDVAVGGQEDVHRVAGTPQRPRQGVDDVGQAAGLEPGLDLRGDEGDPQPALGARCRGHPDHRSEFHRGIVARARPTNAAPSRPGAC